MLKQDKILYDAYIDVIRQTDIRINSKINKATRGFVEKLGASYKPFDVLFSEFALEIDLCEDLAKIVRASLVQQTAIGYGVLPTVNVTKIEAQATSQKLVDIFGKTNGRKLSNQIYKSIDDSQKVVVNTLKQAHKDYLGFNKTVAKMESKLDDIVFKKDQLSGYMQNLEKTGRRLISNNSIENQKEFAKAVKKANLQISKMTGNRGLKGSQKQALEDAILAVKNKSVGELSSSMQRAINAKYKSNMQRLVVSENARVFEQSKFNERYDNPLITAVKFNLSSSHSVYDLCDILADRDGFGLGPGVYPLEQQPRLAVHPNGVSFMTSITRRKVSEIRVKEAGKYKGSDYAKEGKAAGLPPSQVKLLQDLEQQEKVEIDSEEAINIVTQHT